MIIIEGDKHEKRKARLEFEENCREFMECVELLSNKYQVYLWACSCCEGVNLLRSAKKGEYRIYDDMTVSWEEKE